MPAAPVWRTARRPRWLALLGVVLVLCVAFGWLGHWQLDVARAKEHPKHTAVAAPPVPLDQVTAPERVFRTEMQGRPVVVTGRYDATRQVLVASKRQGGRDGVWVVTALRSASGALVPVVRGFAPRVVTALAADELEPPAGQVTVPGVLQAPESAQPGRPTPAAGPVPAADTADLVNRWGGPIYNVLVFASTGEPLSAERVGLSPVPPAPADDGGGLGLRNAAYALQWWLFGAFALLLWWRMVRQDALERTVEPTEPASAPPSPGSPSATAHDDPTEPKELSPR